MTTLALLDHSDLPWLTELLDVVVASAGQPWRVALDALDDTRRFEQPRAPVRFGAAVSAVQRLLGGRARNAVRARAARSLVLGKPALTAAEREARIAFAAGELEVSCAAVETLLWSDVPRERPVELPRGRPSELDIAAFANLQLLQRAVRRAHGVTIRIRGEAGPLIRGAAQRGLLLAVTSAVPAPGGSGAITQLDIVGPLALFHRTAVYGKALADLVPLLAACECFELSITARAREQLYTVELASPVLLPSVPARLTAPAFDLRRLLQELRRATRDAEVDDLIASPCHVTFEAGASLVCPDLVLDRSGRRTYVEIVGFWTVEFLRRKADLYRVAGIDDFVLCADESRACAKDDVPGDLPVVFYSKRVATLASELEHRTRH